MLCISTSFQVPRAPKSSSKCGTNHGKSRNFLNYNKINPKEVKLGTPSRSQPDLRSPYNKRCFLFLSEKNDKGAERRKNMQKSISISLRVRSAPESLWKYKTNFQKVPQQKIKKMNTIEHYKRE